VGWLGLGAPSVGEGQLLGLEFGTGLPDLFEPFAAAGIGLWVCAIWVGLALGLGQAWGPGVCLWDLAFQGGEL
jgi:hypothetical protein